MIEEREGVWWPITESGLPGDLRSLLDIEDFVIPNCPKHRTVIQAGGAVGLWALMLAKHFDAVLTFEPNTVLMQCLLKNTCHVDNIYPQPCALWEKAGKCSMDPGKPKNMGSWGIKPGGATDAIAIDSFDEQIDLIMLDVEGAELSALYGASATIDFWRPTVVFEAKEQCARRYGYSIDKIRQYLTNKDYHHVVSFHGGRDELWRPLP